MTRKALWLMLAGGSLIAQPLSLSQAVDAALRNYPSVQVSREQIAAAAASIQLARTAYLPRIDLLAQVNRATRNNVFAMLLPQAVIPTISGPVIGSNNLGSAWGSAAGTLVTWEPFDFGLRRANVAVSEAARAESQAALERTQYDVAVSAADAYLTLAAAQETVKAAQAAVDRAATIQRTTTALANAQLRPGADASRAEAETAAARTQLIQAQQAVNVARVSLARFVGADPAAVSIAAPGLSRLPAGRQFPPVDTAANPLAVEQNAAIEQARAQLHALERSWFPRFYLQGAAYARGTGAEIDGEILGGANGLAPSTQNYALGFTVNFPVMDRAAIHAREAAQSANIRAESARARQIAVDIRARFDAAVAVFEGGRQVAANTPVEIAAARAATDQAEARYRAGLGNIDAVAEAQRLLAQAEIDDALARLGVWRGLLQVAAAAGDIRPYLAEVGQ
jgi:outer membrane protein